MQYILKYHALSEGILWGWGYGQCDSNLRYEYAQGRVSEAAGTASKHTSVSLLLSLSLAFVCWLFKDNLSFGFLRSSIQPRGAFPQWNQIFTFLFSLTQPLYPNAII